MIRRLLNIVAEKGRSGVYSLHRLDVSKHLFYPSSAAAEATNNNGKICSLAQLPAPVVRFERSPTTRTPWDSVRPEMFVLISPRSGEDRILCSDTAGHTVLYNAESGSIQTMPPLNGDKGFMPMTISIARPGAPEEDLYVMSSVAVKGHRLSSFDVLRFVSRSYYSEDMDWRWDPLPPLPVATNICSHTVVDGGSTICVSAVPSCGGTYYFDTVKREWRKAEGSWVLPFEGRADYVPDLKLWLGLSTESDCQQLCAWDLSTMDQPPKLKHAWTDLETPEDWSLTRFNILDLGSGRFCIAKVFRVGGETFDSTSIEDKFAVLTGVEMVTDGGPEQGLRMVKHKSVHFRFAKEFIRWVL